jgi:competence protein ComEC
MFIEKLPYAIIKGIDISVAECWLIFLIILLSAAFIEYKKYIYIFSSLLFCLVLCIYNLAEKVEQYNQKKVFIYHINKLTAINFIDGSDNILIADKELINNPDKMMFHIYHNWYRSGINTVKFINVNYLDKKRELHNMYRINNDKLFIKENYLQFYNHTFVIINNRKQLFDSLKYRLPVDYVIITKDPDITLNDINRNFEYKAIIADASNSNFKINNWLNELAEVNNKFYNIKDKGAWVLDLNISIY